MTRRVPPNDVRWLQEHLRDPFKVADRICDKKNGQKPIKVYIILNVGSQEERLVFYIL